MRYAVLAAPVAFFSFVTMGFSFEADHTRTTETFATLLFVPGVLCVLAALALLFLGVLGYAGGMLVALAGP